MRKISLRMSTYFGIVNGLEVGIPGHLESDFYGSSFVPRLTTGFNFKIQFNEDKSRYRLFKKTQYSISIHVIRAREKRFLPSAPEGYSFFYDVSSFRLDINYGFRIRPTGNSFARFFSFETGLTYLHLEGTSLFCSLVDSSDCINQRDKFNVPGLNAVFQYVVLRKERFEINWHNQLHGYVLNKNPRIQSLTRLSFHFHL